MATLLNAAAFGVAFVLGVGPVSVAHAAWEPTQSVEIIVPAGPGGGADQMARVIQGIVAKHALMKQSIVVINKAGNDGGDGFLDIKNSKGNPHKLIITLSNLFTTPLATGIPFSYRDATPVAMMALDEFILWTNAEKGYKTAKDFIDAAKQANGLFKMGGTGTKQEDQIITVELEKQTGVKFVYVPLRGGGAVAVQLVSKTIDASVNNPIEAVAHWRAGKLKPLCVFDSKPLDYHDKIHGDLAWDSIPTCKSSGVNVEYLMLRGIFMPAGVTDEQLGFYVDLLKKVRETPEWKDLMRNGAFNTTFLSGDAFKTWLDNEEKRHETLMRDAGFLARK